MDIKAPIIETKGLTKWYGLVIGVNDVNLALERGIYGLLGPNGAGKSTLLNLITGQLKPNSGEVLVFGQRVWGNSRVYRRIGFCPEQDAFYTFLSGLKFVQLLTQMHGFSAAEARRRAEKAMQVVGLADVMENPIRTYSRGMRQRVKIAQAIAHDPDLLILDEPFAGTDPLIRRQLMDILIGLAKQRGKHILISSHILHEIEAMTDQVILIFRGQVRAFGNIHQIRDAMDEFPHRIRIRSNNPRQLLQVLLGLEYVVGVNLGGTGEVHIQTHNPHAFYDLLPRILHEHKIQVSEIYSEDETLQALFRYLTRSV